jgi:serine/threonine protein kinase
VTTPSEDSETYLTTCPSCEGVIDVTILEPYSKITCPHCGQGVRVRRRFDHFSIVRQLGEGGMSRVFDAEDSTLGRHVALKILNRHYSKDSVRMASFEREAQLTAAVAHSNVIKLYSVGRDQGNFYIAMELVGGGSLESRIAEKGRLTEKEALHVGRAIAEGLRAAYREGLIHRDVKPANILFTEDETPKIVDFGLALFHSKDKDESGEIWATPFYVAPEKVRDDTEDFRSDMFSLGATLYHALVGKPPHKANTNSLNELKVIKSRAVKLEDSDFKFSQRTCDLVNRMLALNPKDRHQSYDELIEAFRDAESLLGYHVIGRRSRRRKIVYAAIGAGITALLLAILLKPVEETEVKSIQVNVGTERELTRHSSTLAVGTETVAELFIRARGILVDGNFAEAHKKFDELIQHPRIKQPTLNLARFNAALCAIVEGKKQAAEKYFEDIKRDAEKGQNIAGVDWRDLKDFFDRLGGRMSDNLGLKMERKEVAYETDSEQVLGYLAHGLAKWHFSSQPGTAAEWLEEFNQCSPRKDLEWISNYKKIVEPYLADMQVAKTLGDLREFKFATVDEAKEALSQTKDALAKLKTTGALRNSLGHRIRFAQDEIKRLNVEAEQAQSARLAALRDSERKQLDELSETLPDLLRGYDYSHGVELLEGLKFETPEVQHAVASRHYLWSKAREFMTTLMADVTARGYTGTMNRDMGMPLEGRLSRLEYDNATIVLERGQLQIPTASLTPETLVNIAQSMCANISDSTDYYRRQELIVVFAKLEGLDQIATLLASQLGEENRAFRQRWARIAQGGL